MHALRPRLVSFVVTAEFLAQLVLGPSALFAQDSTEPTPTVTGEALPATTRPAATPSTSTEPAAASAAAGQAAAEHPLRAALRICETSKQALEAVDDYEANIARREMVNGQLLTGTMRIRFREKPFSVYLRFGGAADGREVLYVDGKNQNMLLAHEGSGLKSLVGSISLAPNDPRALAESRHTITDIGMRNLLAMNMERWEAESAFGECEVKYYEAAKLDDTECLVIECSHPRPRRQFKFALSRMYFDKATNFPVRVELYGFPTQQGGQPVLIEECTYRDIKTNVGLTDADFDRSNPNYRF